MKSALSKKSCDLKYIKLQILPRQGNTAYDRQVCQPIGGSASITAGPLAAQPK